MLKRFEVRNYEGFKNLMIWDLSSTRTYANQKNLIKNKISKNSIIYGKNGSGKTCLCTAIMNITYHLLDVQKYNVPYYRSSYIGNNDNVIEYKYVFELDKKEITYFYKELNTRDLLLEQLFVNGKEIIRHDFANEEENFIEIKGLENLKTKGLQRQLSILKYIYNNTIIDENGIINKLFNFVKGMLFFRSVREFNQYIGYKSGADSIDNIIIQNNKVNDFQKFLSNCGINYDLIPITISGVEYIGVCFENGNATALGDICSSGTHALMLFYCWSLEFSKLTFLVIDEFDAFYHFEASKEILKIINSYDNLQSMVTTHNVTLLNTDLTRPDCAYIIDDKGVINLSDRCDKEIRKNHNIEKMYREKEFN